MLVSTVSSWADFSLFFFFNPLFPPPKGIVSYPGPFLGKLWEVPLCLASDASSTVEAEQSQCWKQLSPTPVRNRLRRSRLSL